MKSKSLPCETAARILEAAWARILAQGSLEFTLAEIARDAGVSRQSVYLAFGSRAGLMLAMARHADRQSPHAARMRAIVEADGDCAQALIDYAEAWLRHLPEVYPVGVLLGAAAVTDPETAAVFRDRMEGGLLGGYRKVTDRLAAAGRLAPGWTAATAADLAWSLTHIDAWRQLVVERGWTPLAFRADRIALLRRTLLDA